MQLLFGGLQRTMTLSVADPYKAVSTAAIFVEAGVVPA